MVVGAVLFRRWPVRRGQLTHARVCDSSWDRGTGKGWRGERRAGHELQLQFSGRLPVHAERAVACP